MSDEIGGWANSIKFVAKMTNSGSASKLWSLSEPDSRGQRSIMLRNAAAVFESRREAYQAIARMPIELEQAEISFSVEPAE